MIVSHRDHPPHTDYTYMDMIIYFSWLVPGCSKINEAYMQCYNLFVLLWYNQFPKGMRHKKQLSECEKVISYMISI